MTEILDTNSLLLYGRHITLRPGTAASAHGRGRRLATPPPLLFCM